MQRDEEYLQRHSSFHKLQGIEETTLFFTKVENPTKLYRRLKKLDYHSRVHFNVQLDVGATYFDLSLCCKKTSS